jgi:hypothetical protein
MHWNLRIYMRWHDEAKVQYPSPPIRNRLKFTVSIWVAVGPCKRQQLRDTAQEVVQRYSGR